MSPEPLDDVVRRRMENQRRRDTGLEIAIRKALHALGYRFRIDYRLEPGLRCRGDIVFTRKKVVVFVDGCFWHGCPDHGSRTTTANPDYWADKVAKNKARDSDTDATLTAAGWSVIRAWEHEEAETVARLVFAEVTSRRHLGRHDAKHSSAEA